MSTPETKNNMGGGTDLHDGEARSDHSAGTQSSDNKEGGGMFEFELASRLQAILLEPKYGKGDRRAALKMICLRHGLFAEDERKFLRGHAFAPMGAAPANPKAPKEKKKPSQPTAAYKHDSQWISLTAERQKTVTALKSMPSSNQQGKEDLTAKLRSLEAQIKVVKSKHQKTLA